MHPRARAWLSQRAGAVPPSLEARMESAADGVDAPADDVAAALAQAALHCLQEALGAGEARAAAWPLLAADALITAACEAAADAQADVRTFAQALAVPAIAAIAAEHGGTS